MREDDGEEGQQADQQQGPLVQVGVEQVVHMYPSLIQDTVECYAYTGATGTGRSGAGGTHVSLPDTGYNGVVYTYRGHWYR